MTIEQIESLRCFCTRSIDRVDNDMLHGRISINKASAASDQNMIEVLRLESYLERHPEELLVSHNAALEGK